MSLENIPLNVSLLETGSNRTKGLLPVTSLNMYADSSNDFHPQGLFSNFIFGRQGEDERDVSYSFIDLKTRIFHPLYFKTLTQVNELYGQIILG